MIHGLVDRLERTILDQEGAAPRTAFQMKLAGYTAIATNIVTALTFMMLAGFLAIGVMRLLTEAFDIDPTGFGNMVTFVGLVAALWGGVLALDSVLEISRYQVFTIIGLISVARSMLTNLGEVARQSTEGSVGATT